MAQACEQPLDSVSLLSIPEDCIALVLKNCALEDAISVSRSCKRLHEAFLSAPQECWMHWFFASVFMKPLGDLPRELLAQQESWEEATRHHCDLLKRLHQSPSPGSATQKYLRYLEFTPASAPIIRNAIAFLSLFPKDPVDAFVASPNARPHPRHWLSVADTLFQPSNPTSVTANMYCFSDHSLSVLSCFFAKVSNFPAIQLCPNLTHHFNSTHYLTLFSWILQDHKRLRLLMAEYQQIHARNVDNFLRTALPQISLNRVRVLESSTDLKLTFREMGAFCQLVLLGRRCDDSNKLRLWA